MRGCAEYLRVRRSTGQRLVPFYEEERRGIVAAAVLESWDLPDPDIANRPVENFLGEVHLAAQTGPVRMPRDAGSDWRPAQRCGRRQRTTS